MNASSLFRPFRLKSLNLKSRIVMAPIRRSFAPGSTITPSSAVYYQKRVEGEVGLILFEGDVIERGSSANRQVKNLIQDVLNAESLV